MTKITYHAASRVVNENEYVTDQGVRFLTQCILMQWRSLFSVRFGSVRLPHRFNFGSSCITSLHRRQPDRCGVVRTARDCLSKDHTSSSPSPPPSSSLSTTCIDHVAKRVPPLMHRGLRLIRRKSAAVCRERKLLTSEPRVMLLSQKHRN